MTHRDDQPRQILQTYREHVRPFFQQHQVGGIEALDRQAELLEQAIQRTRQVRVGFVGEAQVGKSSLINAVVGRRVLPAGGIGPLTARATSVDHADEDRMSVRYHDRGALNRLTFGMTRYLESIGEIPKGSAPIPEADPSAADAAADELDLVVEEEEAEAPTKGVSIRSAAREKGEYMLLQAARMLDLEGGDPKPSGKLLVDAMRAVVNKAAVTEPFSPALEARIAELRSLVGTQETLTSSGLGGTAPFNTALRERAAGWRSPLIADLQLGLSAPSLQGLSFVDLPGIGTVADPAARVAKHFVESEGHALVVVFRNSGLTEAVADLLERTGVITRMLFGGSEGHVPIQLLLVVTRLDDVAKNRFEEISENEGAEVDPNQLFQDLAREMQEKLRTQVRAALLKSDAFADLAGDQLQSREGAVNLLCSSMEVLCVSSPEYLSLTGTGKLRSWLTDVEATGIPGFRAALQRLAEQSHARRAHDVEQYATELQWTLLQHLSILRQQYSEGTGAATEESRRFRAALEAHRVSLREAMHKRHGESLGFLRRGLQERIDKVCLEARDQSVQKLKRLKKKGGQDLHYKSLLAALTRNGVWEARNINYPGDLVLAMVDAIAAQWEPQIIEAVRKEIRTLADFDRTLVDQLIQAATELNPKLVAESQIEAQNKILQQASRAALAWTREQLEELRRKVQEKLRGAIEIPIMNACTKARNAGKHQGEGAKERILEVFEEGGLEALEEARKSAEKVLRDQYTLVLRRLDQEYLEQHHDPVTAAFESLTSEMAQRAQRKDRREREAALSLIQGLNEQLGSG